MTGLDESYRLCRQIARQKARNFFYAFLLLPKDRMDPMCGVYAFMRHSDDLVDSASSENRAEILAQWRHETQNALTGLPVSSPILPAFADTVARFSIPDRYIFELLDGVGMDLDKNRYRTFEELYPYCYRVASVVGIVCVHIFGFDDEYALSLAESTGIAFQLTNILRDLREDAAENRIYLPLEDFERFRYSIEDLKAKKMDGRFHDLIRFEIERARGFYKKGEPLIGFIRPECRRTLAALIGIYKGLLEKINRESNRILSKKIKLSMAEKISIIFRTWKNPLSIPSP